jgi:hypothetical protein
MKPQYTDTSMYDPRQEKMEREAPVALTSALLYFTKVVQMLLARLDREEQVREHINTPARQGGNTALHLAVANGHEEVTSFLLDRGAGALSAP